MSIARKKIPGRPLDKCPLVVRYTGRDGKRHEETIKSGLVKDAKRREREIQIELEKGIHVAASQTQNMAFLFGLWLEHYETLVRAGFKAQSTLDNYERDVRLHLLPAFGGTLITRFEALDAQHFVDKMMGKPVLLRDGSGRRDPKQVYNPSRLERITIPLKLALDFAVDHKLVGRNVLKDRPIRLPEQPDVDPEWLQVDDARAILRALDDRRAFGLKGDDNAMLWRNQRLLVLLLMFTGIREAEACGLKWHNVDLDKMVLHVRHQMGRDGVITERLKSRKAKRTIPLNPLLVEALLDQAPRPEDRVGTVLRNAWGAPMRMSTVIATIMPKLRERAGLSRYLTAHKLRHLAGSIWLMQGMRLDLVSRILGHTSPTFTAKVYIHELEQDTQAAEVIAVMHGVITGQPVQQVPAIAPTFPVPMIEQQADAGVAGGFAAPIVLEHAPAAVDFTTKGHRERQRQRALELWKAYRSTKEIAKELGVTQYIVTEWIQQEHGNLRRAVKRAARYEKLTPEQLDAKRARERERYHARRQNNRANVT
jgi:integrase